MSRERNELVYNEACGECNSLIHSLKRVLGDYRNSYEYENNKDLSQKNTMKFGKNGGGNQRIRRALVLRKSRYNEFSFDYKIDFKNWNT